MAAAADVHRVLETFVVFLETDGNVAEIRRRIGGSVTTIYKYRRKYQWDTLLARVRKVQHDQIAAAIAVSKEGSISQAITLRDAAYKKLMTSGGRLSREASASLLQRYRELDRYVLELKGLVPGPSNPETLPEQKIRQVAHRSAEVFVKFLEKIPGASDYLSVHADDFDRLVEDIIEELV